jgi:hypothetical protein
MRAAVDTNVMATNIAMPRRPDPLLEAHSSGIIVAANLIA